MNRRGDEVLLSFHEDRIAMIDTPKLAKIGNGFERRVQFEKEAKAAIRIKAKGLDDKELLELLERFLKEVKPAFKSKGELHNAVK
ncbi:hypothetical protein D3C76_1514470 [compost metagenome]